MNDPASDATRVRPTDPLDGTTAPMDPPASTLPGAPMPPAEPGMPSVPRYTIVRELGRGGMGVVYEARQVGLNRTVALKMILSGAHAGADTIRRFRAEAEVVARLRHPNIVQIYEIDEADGLPYFALEYVAGGTLEQRLASGPLPVAEAVRIAELLAGAVAVAHEAFIVHRDLKPANILLTEVPLTAEGLPAGGQPSGEPKVTDFGLAKLIEGDDGRTATGSVLGTPNYMAPEQAEGRVMAIGPPTDVWALGAVLYAMLTGRPPFKGDSTLQTLDHVRFKQPEPPRRVRPEVPRGLEAVCLKCLAKNPADRYPTAAALAADLARVRFGESLPTAGSHRKRWVILAAAVLLLAVGGIAIATARRGGNTDPGPKTDPPDAPAVAPVAAAEKFDRPPARFALVVGVRAYHGPGYDLELQFTERDVEEFARALNDRGFARRNISVLSQWNQEDNPALAPTAANIRKRLRAMSENARPGDTVVVALAGHGSQTGDPPQFYFWPAGGNPRDPDSLISQTELYAAFDRCRADVKLLLVDACREFPKDAKFDLKVRGGPLLPREPARFAAFYSCSAGQVCWELEKYKHGVFFYHLLDGFRGAADTDKDGQVSLDELVRHTATGVKGARAIIEEVSGTKLDYFQTPELVGDLAKATPIGSRTGKPEAGAPAAPTAPNLFGD